jgi:hypothetical protein
VNIYILFTYPLWANGVATQAPLRYIIAIIFEIMAIIIKIMAIILVYKENGKTRQALPFFLK